MWKTLERRVVCTSDTTAVYFQLIKKCSKKISLFSFLPNRLNFPGRGLPYIILDLFWTDCWMPRCPVTVCFGSIPHCTALIYRCTVLHTGLLYGCTVALLLYGWTPTKCGTGVAAAALEKSGGCGRSSVVVHLQLDFSAWQCAPLREAERLPSSWSAPPVESRAPSVAVSQPHTSQRWKVTPWVFFELDFWWSDSRGGWGGAWWGGRGKGEGEQLCCCLWWDLLFLSTSTAERDQHLWIEMVSFVIFVLAGNFDVIPQFWCCEKLRFELSPSGTKSWLVTQIFLNFFFFIPYCLRGLNLLNLYLTQPHSNGYNWRLTIWRSDPTSPDVLVILKVAPILVQSQ